MKQRRVQITFDCADPEALARFWAETLGYPAPDVEGFRDKLRSLGIDEEELHHWCLITDPTEERPPLFFQLVPEPKIVKNRVHLDVRAPEEGPGDRRQQIDAEAERLVGLGARVLHPVEDEGGYFVVMQDPEGNEFCID